MARDIYSASSQYFIGNQSIITDEPITMACWFFPLATPSGVPFSCGTSGTDNRLQIQVTSTNITVLRTRAGVSNASAIFTGTFTFNIWYHVVATISPSGGEIAIWSNGVKGGTTGVNPGLSMPISEILIGARRVSTPGNFFTGSVAELSLWNTVLTSSEIESLAKGFRPSRIRPSGLSFYTPFIRETHELRNGVSITNANGSFVRTHPRII